MDLDLDWDYYLKEYPNLSRKDLERIRDDVNKPTFCPSIFEFVARHLDFRRGQEKIYGKPSVRAAPLVQVLGVDVQPIGLGKRKSLSVFGQISTGGHDVYNRDISDVETLGLGGGNLTLSGPSPSCRSSHAYLSPQSTKLSVKLFDEEHIVLVQDIVSFDNASDVFEEVKIKSIQGDQVVLNLNYVSIPMGVYARLSVEFFNKQYERKVPKLYESVNVYGRVVAKYQKTFGNYSSEEIVLFEKKSTEYERVGVDSNNNLDLSRYWVAVPAYSVLALHLSLFEYGTGERIIEEKIDLDARSYHSSGSSFIVGDFVVAVSAAWFPPEAQGQLEYKFSDDGDEMISTSLVKGVDSESPLQPWTLQPHMGKPLPSPAIEVFSVVIGREKWKAVEIFGSIEMSDDYNAFNVFRKDEKAAMRLLEGSKTMPMLDGSGVFGDGSLKIVCDLKDILGTVSIKGYVEWDAEVLDSYYEEHLCSVIQGDNGFAALHYAIFQSAVQAKLRVFWKQKSLDGVGAPSLRGSIFAQYSNYEYPSKYDKDCFRSMLFKRTDEDSLQVDVDGMIQLSRSTVFVPSDSSLVIDVDLVSNMSSERLLCSRELKIGANSMIFETEECVLRVELEWGEVK